MTKSRRIFLTACALFCMMMSVQASGKSEAGAKAKAIVVTDALGRKVELPAVPQRIAVTGKALFMTADAIYMFPEAGQRITAIGNAAQGKNNFAKALDPKFGDKIALDSNAGAEAIAATKPDLVILKSSIAGALGKAVEATGLPVMYVDFETPAQYERDIANLGLIFQNEKRAAQLISLFATRRQAVEKAVAGIEEAKKPRALFLYYNEQGGAISFSVPPLDWMQAIQIKTGGGQLCWTDVQLGKGWTKVGIEQIAVWNPDHIFISAYFSDLDKVLTTLKADPKWASLKAVQNQSLHAFPADYYSFDQPDPRWILGLEWVAAKLHPASFPGFDMNKQLRSFYADFYQLDDRSYAAIVEPFITSALR